MFSVVTGGVVRGSRRTTTAITISPFPPLEERKYAAVAPAPRFRKKRFSVSFSWLPYLSETERIRTARLNETVVVQPDIKSVSGQLTILRLLLLHKLFQASATLTFRLSMRGALERGKSLVSDA